MSAPRIHPTALVDPQARLGSDVEIGPFCLVGPDVEIGPGSRLLSHAVVLGPTTLGARTTVHPFAALGGPPQDRSYSGEPTVLLAGDDNTFREHVTVHRGTTKDQGITRIGSGNLFMAGAHIAHDCRIGDHVTLANATLLAGHVHIADHVVTGGHTAVQPFVRLGSTCFLAGGAMVEHDVPPFTIAAGDRARVRALNLVGLRRRGTPDDSLAALRSAFRLLFRSGLPRAEAASKLAAQQPSDPFVRELLAFVRSLTPAAPGASAPDAPPAC